MGKRTGKPRGRPKGSTKKENRKKLRDLLSESFSEKDVKQLSSDQKARLLASLEPKAREAVAPVQPVRMMLDYSLADPRTVDGWISHGIVTRDEGDIFLRVLQKVREANTPRRPPEPSPPPPSRGNSEDLSGYSDTTRKILEDEDNGVVIGRIKS